MITKILAQKLRERIMGYRDKRAERSDEVSVVEATQFVRSLARISGISMFDMTVLPSGRVQVKKWTPLGVICSVVFTALFIWCTYYSTVHQQNIVLGVIYDSILQYYGEHVRTVMSAAFVFYVSVLSFVNKAKIAYWEDVLMIDSRLREIGVRVDCSKMRRQLHLVVFVHFFFILVLSLLLYSLLLTWNVPMPLCKIFQMVYTLSMTMHCLMTYYYGAYIMRDRYRYVNELLNSVLEDAGSGLVVVLSEQQPGRSGPQRTSCKEITALDTILKVRKIYSLMNHVDKANMSKFGTIAVMMISVSFVSIILHIFYMMEATARGLTRDYNKYLFFMGYNGQQAIFAFLCIFYIVLASENVYSETSRTPRIVHNIINQNTSPEVEKQASLLSLQLLHERYKYTAKGLFEIDFSFLLSVVGSITTYLIILLQFATYSNIDFKDIRNANNTSNWF